MSLVVAVVGLSLASLAAPEPPQVDPERPRAAPVPPPIRPTPLAPPPAVEQWTSPGGTTVAALAVPELRRVAVSVRWTAGRAQLCPSRPAACEALLALLPRGPSGWEGGDWEHALDVRGVWLHGWVGVDESGLDMSVPAEHLPAALALFEEALLSPALPRWDVRATRREWRAELRREWPRNAELLRDQAYRSAWLAELSPGVAGGVGAVSELRGLRTGALLRVHGALLASPAVLAVGGGIELETHRAALNSLAEVLQPTAPGPRSPRPVVPGTRIVAVDVPAAEGIDAASAPTWVCAARRGVPTSPDETLLATVLWAGSTGRVDRELREERGWSYGTESGVEAIAGHHRHWMQLVVPREHAGQTIHHVEQQLAALAHEGPTAAEAALAANALRRAANRTRATPESAVEHAISTVLRPESTAALHRARAAALTAPAAAIQRAARTWTTPPAHGLWIVVGPRASLAPALDAAELPVEWWHWQRGRLRPQPAAPQTP